MKTIKLEVKKADTPKLLYHMRDFIFDFMKADTPKLLYHMRDFIFDFMKLFIVLTFRLTDNLVLLTDNPAIAARKNRRFSIFFHIFIEREP